MLIVIAGLLAFIAAILLFIDHQISVRYVEIYRVLKSIENRLP